MESRRQTFPVLSPRTSSDVRIVIWNVHYGNSKNHTNEVAEALKSFNCDTMLLAEVRSDRGLIEKILELGYGGEFVPMNYRQWFRPVAGGIAFFSRYAIESLKVYEFVRDHWSKLTVRRYYIEARVTVSENFSLTVGMVHHTLPFELGIKEANKELYRLVTRREDENFLFAGDLNSHPRFRLVKKLCRRFVNLGPSLEVPSHTMVRRPRSSLWEGRVDYAFASQRVADMLVEPARFGEMHPSDHAPLIVHLRVKP
jgi:endonuclease/exonuclease/phosphatase family metal-dependent hydrolase